MPKSTRWSPSELAGFRSRSRQGWTSACTSGFGLCRAIALKRIAVSGHGHTIALKKVPDHGQLGVGVGGSELLGAQDQLPEDLGVAFPGIEESENHDRGGWLDPLVAPGQPPSFLTAQVGDRG